MMVLQRVFEFLHSLPPSERVNECCMLGCVQLFATPWTITHRASLSMGFSRQEHWSGLPFPSPGDLPDSEIKPGSPALAGNFFFFFLLPNHLGRPVLSPNNGTIILLSLLTNRMWHKVMLITPEFRSQNGSPVWLFLSWITCCRGRQEPCCEKLKQPVERTMCGGTGASCQQPASSGQPQETATVETDLPASVKPTF